MRVLCQKASMISGLALIIIGAVVKGQIDLSPGTEAYESGAGQSPIDQDVLIRFTLLNVINPDEVRRGEKPIVEDVGPFTYKEIRRKYHVLTVNEHISYGSFVGYEFQRELSVDDDTVKLTIINPILSGLPALINLLGDIPPQLDALLHDLPLPLGCGSFYQCLNFAVNGLWDCGTAEYHADCTPWSNVTEPFKDDIFSTVSPREILFDGYAPGILNFALMMYDYAKWMLRDLDALKPILDEFNITIPADFQLPELPTEIAGGKFALFSNATTLNRWAKINSGKYDLQKSNSYVEYNGMTKLPETWWPDFGPTPNAHKSGVKGICKDIVGTDGSMYPPFISKDDDLWLFNTDLCRSTWLSFEKEENLQDINTYMYSVSKDVLSMENPHNLCYCPGVEKCAVQVEGKDEWDISACTHCKNGMLHIIGCRGVPVVMSNPHFLDGDPSLPEDIDGMNPNAELHKTYFNIVPEVGLPIEAHKRMQANIPLYKWDLLDVLNNVPEVVFPLLWIDTGFNLDEATAAEVKRMLRTTKH